MLIYAVERTHLNKIPLVKELFRWQSLLTTQFLQHQKISSVLTSNPGKELSCSAII